MAEVLIMPKLGFNMDEGQLVKWHRAVGESFKKGEVLFEINTDKTTMPVEATCDATMLKIVLNEGEFADVFTPIAVIGNAGDNADAAIQAHVGGDSAAASQSVAANEVDEISGATPSFEVSADTSDLKLTPRAKKYIAENDIDVNSVAQIQGTGFQGGITASDIKASPLAKKIAELNNVDLANVQGSGVNNKVMKSDVLASGSASSQCCAQDTDMMVLEKVPYKGVRKIIGDRLAQSKFTAPHLYFTDAIDTSKLTAFRTMLNSESEIRIAVSDLLTLAATKCLEKFPDMNSSLIGDEIIKYKSCNVGTAVAGDNGLIVPNIKNAQSKTLTQIAKESKDLIARAKENRLDPSEFNGGTFTISNLGMFGIGNFTAIINPPEAAIIAISSVRKTPIVIENENGEDEVVIRPMMNVQLTVDHRIIDGLLAAKFLAHFKYLLENPIHIVI